MKKSYKSFMLLLIFIGICSVQSMGNGKMTLAKFLATDKETLLTLPYFDYRDLGIISHAKNQRALDTCWAFAAIGSLEGNLSICNAAVDLSEDHMILGVKDASINYHSGGQNTLAENYYAARIGPVAEAEDAYGDGKRNKEAKVLYDIEGIIYPKKDITAIKKTLLQYGAVQASIHLGDFVLNDGQKHDTFERYFDSLHNSFYYNGEEKVNHDVVIVGWNDRFKKEHFKIKPPADGAWIVKNSYGRNWGENGFFYVSYYDRHFPGEPSVVTKVKNHDEKETLYYHDDNGYTSHLGYEDTDADFMAAIFEKKAKDEKLSAVTVAIADYDTSYKLYYVADYQGVSDLTQKRVLLFEGIFKERGYYVMRLPEALPVGSKFALIASLDCKDPQKRLTVDPYAVGDRPNQVVKGTCFISADGTQWDDGYYPQDLKLTYDVCIRGITTRE